MFVLVQLFFAYIFVVDTPAYGWDFGAVHSAAVADLLGGTKIVDEWYFYRYSNNLGIAILLRLFYGIGHALGINNYTFLGIALNIISIDIAIFYLYKTIKLFFDKKQSDFFLVLSLLTTPFITYTPIFYSDTLSLPFAIASIYYVFKHSRNNRQHFVNLFIAGLLLGIGSCLKFTVIIILISLFLYYFFKENKIPFKNNIKQIMIITIATIIPLLTFSIYKNNNMDKKMLEKESFPLTHWIMMGTVGKGGYYYEDVEYTSSFKTKEQKKEMNIKKIKERINTHLKNYDLVKFYNKKIVYTWGDGTFFAPEKLSRYPKKNLAIKSYILNDKNNKSSFYQIFAQTQWFLVLLFIILGIIFRKYLTLEQRNLQLLLNISIFGIYLFLLIWEARSRYLVNYIPILLLNAALGVVATSNYLEDYHCKKSKSKI